MTNSAIKLTALVAEDCEELRSIVARSLEGLGYAVSCVATGCDAVTLLKDRYFDLVVTDLVMPEEDGIAVMSEMGRRYPSARIIAMTGAEPYLSSSSPAKVVKQLGAHAVLLKPFTHAEFVATVSGIVAHAAGVPQTS